MDNTPSAPLLPPDQNMDGNEPASDFNSAIDYVPVPIEADLPVISDSIPASAQSPQVMALPLQSSAKPEQQVSIAGKAVLQQAVIKLLGLARREVLIILPTIHMLFDDEQITQSLIDFVKYSAKREVMILINTLADQQATSHQLIKLAQRMSSRIPLRQTSNLLETPVMETDYLLIIDRKHILRIDDIDKYSGWFDVNFASRAQQYAASLIQQWPKAKEIREFRQFTL